MSSKQFTIDDQINQSKTFVNKIKDEYTKNINSVISNTIQDTKNSNKEFEGYRFWRQDIIHRQIENSRKVKDKFDLEFDKLKKINIAHQLDAEFKQQKCNLDLEIEKKDRIIGGFVEKIRKRDEE